MGAQVEMTTPAQKSGKHGNRHRRFAALFKDAEPIMMTRTWTRRSRRRRSNQYRRRHHRTDEDVLAVMTRSGRAVIIRSDSFFARAEHPARAHRTIFSICEESFAWRQRTSRLETEMQIGIVSTR